MAGEAARNGRRKGKGKARTAIPWKALELEFLSSWDLSLRGLAARHGLSAWDVWEKAKAERWQERRAEMYEKARAEACQQAVAALAEQAVANAGSMLAQLGAVRAAALQRVLVEVADAGKLVDEDDIATTTERVKDSRGRATGKVNSRTLRRRRARVDVSLVQTAIGAEQRVLDSLLGLGKRESSGGETTVEVT